jgi:hypothetical protein
MTAEFFKPLHVEFQFLKNIAPDIFREAASKRRGAEPSPSKSDGESL